jgi:IPT/TIG domain/Dockerin type I domain
LRVKLGANPFMRGCTQRRLAIFVTLAFLALPALADEVANLHALLDRTWETQLRESPRTAGGSATSTRGYTYLAAPAITNINPTSGSAVGSQSVTITGTNLSGATSVTFGGTAGAITANTATSITVTTPAHAAGAVDVVVTTAGGSATSTGGYTFVAAPTITNINPTSGTTAGGTALTITGTNLSGATVTIGGSSATVTGTTATTATFTTPAHAAGAVDVTVTTAGGSATSTNGYTYVAAPTITNINPTSGTTAGGTALTITGTNLSGATVTIGGSSATVTGTTATTATFTTPAHAAGAVDVTGTTAGGSATLTGGYTYMAFPHGDANGDGQVTVADVFYLINYLFAGGPAPIGSGDANGDGSVTVSDVFYLINYLFAGGPAPV